MRILSLDVGDKRIGIAISDPLGLTAQGIETLTRTSNEKDMSTIKELIENKNIERIVIGLPKNMNGTIGPQGEKTQKFGDKLQDFTNKKVLYWDERLTSVAANKAMIKSDVRRGKRKEMIDQLAAILILQSYLDYINREQEQNG